MSNLLQITPDPPLLRDEFREVDAMRALRRRRRLGDVQWGDLAYRVYTTALGTIVVVIFASGVIGDTPLDDSSVDALRRTGPAWAGLVAAVMLLIGTRSGWRGGPIAMEAADVHNLLLAPVPRWRVLLRPAIGTVGYGSAAMAACGALVGLLIAQRAPGGNAAFVTAGIIYGLVSASIAFGAAMLTSSRRIDGRIPVAFATVLVAVSVAQITGSISWSPMGIVGDIAFWPLRFTPASLVSIVVAVLFVAAGLRLLDGLSIELAQRRTQLVGQLRFAVTQQDLRSVLLLRRQLASEHPIGRNRLRILTKASGRRFPVTARFLSSIGRWPAIRITRVLVLGLAAGVTARAAWHGTTPLVIAAGLCGFIAALDVLEPLAQEIDHPLLVDSYPEERGVLFLRHLLPASLVMVFALVPGTIVAIILEGNLDGTGLVALTTITSALAAIAGGAVSIVGEAIMSATDEAMMPPEVAGPRVVFKTIWPPLVAVTGFAPVVGAVLSQRAGGDVVRGALLGAGPPVVLCAAVAAWVYYRDEIHKTMSEAMGR